MSDLHALSGRLLARLPWVDGLARIAGAQMPVPPPPLTPEDCRAVESALGFALPAVLRHVYLTVANGGFGPGYGLTGIGPTGFADDNGETADRRYATDRSPDPRLPGFDWPEALLPICDFGCAIYHCVDCRSGEVLIWDPTDWTPGDPADRAIFLTGIDIGAWFDRWSRGEALDQYLRDPEVVRTSPPGSVTLTASLADRRAKG